MDAFYNERRKLSNSSSILHITIDVLYSTVPYVLYTVKVSAYSDRPMISLILSDESFVKYNVELCAKYKY